MQTGDGGPRPRPTTASLTTTVAEKIADAAVVTVKPAATFAPAALETIGGLVLDGGEAVFDSRVITEYVDTLSPVGKLIPPSGRERVEVRTWEALADGLCDAALLARMEATWGPREGARCQAWIDRQLSRIDAAVKAMGRGLGDKPWCNGNHFTLADVAVGVALGYLDFRFAQIDWRADHANLARLVEKLSTRPSFVDTAPPVT